MIDKKLDEYGRLAVIQGINLQKGEDLVINSPIECADLARAVARQGYEAGARKVTLFWNDAELSKIKYKYEDVETLTDIPQWLIDSRNHIVDTKACYINIISEDPDGFADVDARKLIAASRASRIAMKKFRDSTSNNNTRWLIIAYPNAAWAKKMFPELDAEKAVEKQWEYIHKTMRMDSADSLKEWKRHETALCERSKFLTDSHIKYFHYKNSLGTDFRIGMPKGYKFTGAREKSLGGIDFTANMPTEEVFSSPDRTTAEGTLVASMPLIHNGNVIDKFALTFKNGKVTDYRAETGYEILKGIIETDEGSAYLGEIALVGYNTPIRNLNTLFYNTLFDENASCHFALGNGFPSCFAGGSEMSEKELIRNGINVSLEHTDFMVGTADLTITAETEDGKKLSIFTAGDWDLKVIG